MMLLRYVALAACIALCSASSAKTPDAKSTKQPDKPVCPGSGSKKSNKIFTVPAIKIPKTDTKAKALIQKKNPLDPKNPRTVTTSKAKICRNYNDWDRGHYLERGDEVTDVKVLEKNVEYSFEGKRHKMSIGKWNEYFEPEVTDYYDTFRKTPKQSFKLPKYKTKPELSEIFKKHSHSKTDSQWKRIGQTVSPSPEFAKKRELWMKKRDEEALRWTKKLQAEIPNEKNFAKDDEVEVFEFCARRGVEMWHPATILEKQELSLDNSNPRYTKETQVTALYDGEANVKHNGHYRWGMYYDVEYKYGGRQRVVHETELRRKQNNPPRPRYRSYGRTGGW